MATYTFLTSKLTQWAPQSTPSQHTHIGQYMHISNFTRWCRKIAWLRALVHRAHKICSNSFLMRRELQRIAEFTSWNGYPRRMDNDLIKSFSMKNNQTAAANQINQQDEQVFPTAWFHLLYIGKKEKMLVKSCTRKIPRLLKTLCKFTTIYDTTNANTILTLKERTEEELQRSVVYNFSCPGC